MTTGCYETSLLLFTNARGAGTLLTVKCPSPGTHRETNARGLPGGGMLAVGIDSHITIILVVSINIIFCIKVHQVYCFLFFLFSTKDQLYYSFEI